MLNAWEVAFPALASSLRSQLNASMLSLQVMLNAREVAFPSRPAVSAEAKDFIRRCLLASVFWLESMLL